MLPTFIIIGVQRGGTTSLYKYLTRHPKIFPSIRKEVHFFDNKFRKGVRWYESQFKQNFIFRLIYRKKKFKDTITGEASPYYIYHPLAPHRMSKIIPDVKLIVLFRNPIERAYSHYHHERRMGVERLSFEDALKEEQKRLQGEQEKMLADENYYSFNHQNFSYQERGIYVEQLQRWEKFFPKEQIKIFSSEEFYLKPNEICKQIFEFIGLNDIKLGATSVFNSGHYKNMNDYTRKKLSEFFEPHNQKLYKYLNKDFNWK